MVLSKTRALLASTDWRAKRAVLSAQLDRTDQIQTTLSTHKTIFTIRSVRHTLDVHSVAANHLTILRQRTQNQLPVSSSSHWRVHNGRVFLCARHTAEVFSRQVGLFRPGSQSISPVHIPRRHVSIQRLPSGLLGQSSYHSSESYAAQLFDLLHFLNRSNQLLRVRHLQLQPNDISQF